MKEMEKRTKGKRREQGNAIIIKETILTEKDIHANMAWKIC